MGELIEFESATGKGTGYIAIPENGTGKPVLLCHAWWGLNDFFSELADRLAGEGYVVLAPDLYEGRTASTIDEAKVLISALDENMDEAIKKEEAALDCLLKHPAVQGKKVGAIGFSMGASYALWLSALREEIAAIVLFYGGSDWQPEGFVQRTKAALLGHFAPDDPWESSEDVPKLEAALRDAGKEATTHFYPGAGHWFFESNRPDVYDPQAAQLAWERTLTFLRDKLG